MKGHILKLTLMTVLSLLVTGVGFAVTPVNTRAAKSFMKSVVSTAPGQVKSVSFKGDGRSEALVKYTVTGINAFTFKITKPGNKRDIAYIIFNSGSKKFIVVNDNNSQIQDLKLRNLVLHDEIQFQKNAIVLDKMAKGQS